MYHSITIGDKNTWTDWHLIPATRPFVSLPSVNEKSVEIPGMNGSIDLTTYLTGSPTYSNRKGSWEFYVMHELWGDDWFAAQAQIANYLHGKKHSVILEDHPTYSYYGRLKMSYRPGKEYSTITIEYDLEPYRTNVNTGAKVIT